MPFFWSSEHTIRQDDLRPPGSCVIQARYKKSNLSQHYSLSKQLQTLLIIKDLE